MGGKRNSSHSSASTETQLGKKAKSSACDLVTKNFEQCTFIAPLKEPDPNKDKIIIFEIKNAEDEYLCFNKDFQVRLELCLYETEFASDNKTVKGYNLVLNNDAGTPTPAVLNKLMFPSTSCGLCIFKSIKCSYNNSTKDETFNCPQD